MSNEIRTRSRAPSKQTNTQPRTPHTHTSTDKSRTTKPTYTTQAHKARHTPEAHATTSHTAQHTTYAMHARTTRHSTHHRKHARSLFVGSSLVACRASPLVARLSFVARLRSSRDCRCHGQHRDANRRREQRRRSAAGYRPRGAGGADLHAAMWLSEVSRGEPSRAG